MDKDDKMFAVFVGVMAGAIFGLAIAPIWILMNVNPMYWFIFIIWLCIPAGGLLAFKFRETVLDWVG
jgi:hypothetical protein